MASELDSLQLTSIGKGIDAEHTFSALTGTAQFNSGFDRINQSLSVIFNTFTGEAPMLPILGSKMDYLLFEPNDEVLCALAEQYAREAIENLEPRISITKIDTNCDDNTLYLRIQYRLTNTNIAGQFDTSITRSNGGDSSGKS